MKTNSLIESSIFYNILIIKFNFINWGFMMLRYITQIILLFTASICINLFSMEKEIKFMALGEDILSNIIFFTVNKQKSYLNDINLSLKNIKQYFALKLVCKNFKSIIENEILVKIVFNFVDADSFNPITSSTLLRFFLKKYIEKNGLNQLKQQFSLELDNHKKMYDSIMHSLDDPYKNSGLSSMERELLIASAVGDEDKAKDLMQRCVNPDICNILHFTPLMLAVMNNNKFIVNLLILCGASLENKNFLDNTALKIAIDNGCSEMIEILREAGAFEEELLPEKNLRESGILLRRNSLSNRRSIRIPFKRANSFKGTATIEKKKKDDSKKDVKKEKSNGKCISM